MPLIQVKLIENVCTAAQKRQIITKLTDAMVSIEGENMRPAHVGGGRRSTQRRMGH